MKMRTPPAISSGWSDSESRSSAKRTPTNGWRLLTITARAAPTRETAVNQRMFVRKSGPTTAYAKPSHVSAAEVELLA